MTARLQRRISLAAVAALLTLLGAGAGFAVEPHGAMLRYPDVSATHVVFLYANDLWLVPRDGGTATRLASPPGQELLPKFNSTGDTIAFVGNYDGNDDLYTVPAAGGSPTRITHHPGLEILTDWVGPDRLMFYTGDYDLPYPRAQEMFTVPAAGGLPSKLPVPYGAVGAVSADGRWLAYTPHTRDQRTWKRYRGGMATDLWLFDLEDHTSEKITDWEGTDTLPMWHGSRVYYLSDAGPAHKLNIWVYDTSTSERRQVTRFDDYDVKWPSIGPDDGGAGEIVFQHGSRLLLLDLESERTREVEVTIPGDRPKIRPQAFDVADAIRNEALSATGKRAAVEARGDIWTVPAEHGSPINLTRSSGVAERSPSWSPDGRWIAYISDEPVPEGPGGYELYLRQSDGTGEARRLTTAGKRYLYGLTWAPDSQKIAFWDQAGELWLFDLDSDELTGVYDSVGLGPSPVSWSHDSNWLAFAMSEKILRPSRVILYDVSEATAHTVTAGMFNDSWPTFDRAGDFLYLASQREFSEPIYEDVGSTWIYSQVDRLYAVPLRSDVASPLAPKSDDETWDDESGDSDADDDDEEDGESEDDAPVEIDLEDFERRMIELPADRGNFLMLAVNDEGKLLYLRQPGSELLGEPAIHLLDPEADEEHEKEVLSGAESFRLSADGKKLLAVSDGGMAIVEARPDQKMKPLSTAGMTAVIDPRAEWRQIFNEAWRLQRDFFYDPNMHGVDWEAVREHYAPMIEDCSARSDVSYVIREMISELNVGHSYYFGGDIERAPTVSVGMLGVDFELANGAYRISRVVEGAAWDADARGPLSAPALDVTEGDYVLAVNGSPIDASKDPWASFQGLAGRTVTLTVSDSPSGDDVRHVVVELARSERDLRYRSWIEANRSYVEERTDGRVGYIYVPNTGIQGQNDLVRQFFGQIHKEALIIDERWNGGGQVPTRFIELLNRPVANYWSLREADDLVWPYDAHHGPKCMLINGLAGSGGDYFPFWFREAGLGKLIGTRTWGGLVGIGGTPPLIDGGVTTAPNFAFYEKDGTWGIEGHGVDPDIEVIDDPALMVGGGDPQLDAAIAHMLEELETNPYSPPTAPAYPDRSGMGLTPEDH